MHPQRTCDKPLSEAKITQPTAVCRSLGYILSISWSYCQPGLAFVISTTVHTLHIYRCVDVVWQYTVFVVVNFDALAQASDFRIKRRQVVFLCWMQDSNPEGLWNPISSRLNMMASCHGNNFRIIWIFVTVIYRSSVDFPHKGQIMQNFAVSFLVSLNKLLSKQSSCW